MEDKEKQPKKRFNIFDWYYKQGKSNDKEDINVLKDPGVINFFKLFWNKLGKLISANLIFVFGNFPIVFLLLAMSGIFSQASVSPLYQSWGPLYGAITFDNTPITSALLGIYGANTTINVINTPTIVLFCLGALIIFTWGFTNLGTTYLYRNMMNGDAIFPFSDFMYVVKKNFKQAFVFGIIDALITGMFAYNIYFLFINYNAADLNAFMLFLTVAMAILYSFARPYAYTMIFTFDLPLSKIIKNALFFTILGVKRNLVALLGMILFVAINYSLFVIFMPLGALLPFVITISLLGLLGVYASYPVIIKYMMDERDAKAIIERKPLYEDTESIE